MAPTDLVRGVVEDRLTHLSEAKLANLERCVADLEAAAVPGDLVEAGVVPGGSAILLASLMGPGRRFDGYDVFGADTSDGHAEDLPAQVEAAFLGRGLPVDGERISLHRGLFEETLRPRGPIALAHVDCDRHDAVRTCLERIHPHLSPGGYLILDDYNDSSGCRTAADHFLAEHPELEVITAGSNLVARRRDGAPARRPTTAVGSLTHEEGSCSFTVVGGLGEDRVRFWGGVPQPESPSVETALASSLIPAMTSGGELALPLAPDPRLLATSEDLQGALVGITAAGPFAPLPLRPVEITAPGAGDGSAREAAGIGLFFSGGVDSWTTLLRRPDVTDLIYVHGFDVPIDRPDASAAIEERLAEVAASRGLRLHTVRTDLRLLLDRAIGWEIGHGPALASVAHLFSPLCREVLIGSGVTYGEPVRRGSHPLVDHLWSTGRCRIVNDGTHLSRAEKVELMASEPQALATLRVCWQRVDEYNCGRCEKCLRTMAALEALGVLERCPTFPTRLDLDALAELSLPSGEFLPWWEDNLRLAWRHGRRPLVEALERCLTSNRERLGDPPNARLLAAEARAGELATQLDLLVNSRSWRLGSVLRRTAAAARRLTGG